MKTVDINSIKNIKWKISFRKVNENISKLKCSYIHLFETVENG